MRYLRFLSLAAWLSVTPVLATAGFAEWEVYTPGGNLISHSDLWKDEHGTCLRSEAEPDASKATIYASHLVRWRFFEGHVAGEDGQGHFLFDESEAGLTRFASEAELIRVVESRRLTSISTWLGPGDGWQEAWFPFMVWRPCKIILGEDERVIAGLSAEEIEQLRQAAGTMYTPSACRAALDETRFALYRRTTWGRLCLRWSEKREKVRDEHPYLLGFCEELRP